MKVQQQAEMALAEGFASIAKQFELPDDFPPIVTTTALAKANAFDFRRALQSGERKDATDIPYVTLDPATSTDLDQAFALTHDANEIVLSYVLADLSDFVALGGELECEAWKRGVTIYGFAKKVPLYPSAISQKGASLLPDGPRPAVQVVVSIDADGQLRLRSIDRVICASRAKFAYSTVDLASIPYLEEFAKRLWLNESNRGAVRFEFPQQEVVADDAAPGGVRLELRSPLYSEQVNATLSLSVNLMIGELLKNAKVGIFRVMDEPERRAVERLRREAHALKIDWARQETVKEVQRRLDPNNLVHQRFLLTVRRAGGLASYATYSEGKTPWHAAIGATYAHATAPMRRLVDRYVLDLACLLSRNEHVPSVLMEKIDALPNVMARAEGRSKGVDRAVIDLIEAVSLQHRIGEILEAEVVDAEGGIVQTFDSAIRSRAVELTGVSDGDLVRVRIEKADPVTRKVVLRAISRRASH